MKKYSYSYIDKNTGSKSGVIEANSHSDAVYKIARLLGYQGKQTFQGNTSSYITKCSGFSKEAPLCIAIRLLANEPKAYRYYKCTK